MEIVIQFVCRWANCNEKSIHNDTECIYHKLYSKHLLLYPLGSEIHYNQCHLLSPSSTSMYLIGLDNAHRDYNKFVIDVCVERSHVVRLNEKCLSKKSADWRSLSYTKLIRELFNYLLFNYISFKQYMTQIDNYSITELDRIIYGYFYRWPILIQNIDIKYKLNKLLFLSNNIKTKNVTPAAIAHNWTSYLIYLYFSIKLYQIQNTKGLYQWYGPKYVHCFKKYTEISSSSTTEIDPS